MRAKPLMTVSSGEVRQIVQKKEKIGIYSYKNKLFILKPADIDIIDASKQRHNRAISTVFKNCAISIFSYLRTS